MGDFSRNTFNKLNHYVSVRMQQGVPLIDADWNEQEDIRKYELRTFLKWFIGNGVPKGNDGFSITQIAGGGAGTIVLTSNKKTIGLSSIVIDLEASTAAKALGFGPDIYSASRLGSSPARLVGNLSETFTLEEGMKLVVSTDGSSKEEVMFQASDFKDISAADSSEVVTAINNTVENFTASVGQGNDFIIKGGTENDPGYCLVEGWDVMIEGDINYTGQPLYENESLAIKWNVKKLEPLSPPTDGERTDMVYLDVWEREVDAYEDDKLINEDIGIETCVRLKREWVVRVAENLPDEGGLKEHIKNEYLEDDLIFPPDHVYYPLALLKRTATQNVINEDDIIKDLRHIVAANGQSPTQSTQAADALSITGGTVDGDLFVNGNLGIGTSTRAAKLDVKGDIVSSGKISSQNSRAIASARNIIQSDGSSDWADMPDMAVDITTGNNMLLVLFKAGGLYLEGPSQEPACFRLVVDSQLECDTVHHVYKDGWDVRDLTLQWMGEVEAGIHNIKVQWLQPQDKVITCCKNQDTRSLIAVEL